MAYNTVIQQGTFTSTGANVNLNIESGVDWLYVYNYTVFALGHAGANVGAYFYWQRGMPNNRCLEVQFQGTIANNPLTSLLTAVNGGVFLLDTSSNPVGNPIAETAITNAVQPVIDTGTTAPLVTGSIVRLSNDAGAPNLMGFDFEVDTIVAATSFRMRAVLANAPGHVGTGGFYRYIQFDPIFYPRRRYVVNISQAAQAQVTVSVSHGLTVGQQVRLTVPAAFGMVQMDGLAGIVTTIVDTLNFTVNIDSTAFTAFQFPLVAAVPYTWAESVPFGEDTGTALAANANILADATLNTAFTGVQLVAGADSPAGQNGDVIYWVAGKSFNQ